MKFIFIAALLILIFSVLSYAQRDKSICDEPEKNKTASDDIILTVCNYAGGMVPLPRRRLYFRLYRNGIFEYEVNAKPNPITGVVSDKLLLKRAQISSKDTAEIIRLGQMNDFQNAASVYPVFRIWTDSRLETTLIFKHTQPEKKIVVNNFSRHDEKTKEYYPEALLAMLQNVWDWRPPDYIPTVRDILINQPDFAAAEITKSSFMGHGFSTTYKIIKLGDCYRRESTSQIINYSCLNGQNANYEPNNEKHGDESRNSRKYTGVAFISDVQTFAKAHEDVEYIVHGKEKIGEQICLKIEARVTDKESAPGNQEITYVFYAAENLRNLVIGVDVIRNQGYASSRLSNIRFDFPHSLFDRPKV